MERVEITRPVQGICHMQVCAVKDADDEEILRVCNSKNPSGTSNGWAHVIRTPEEWAGSTVPGPVPCADHKDREHILVAC